MKDLLAFAVKEEIIRSVLKGHNIVFLSGWSKTGKTVSLLRALSAFETKLYFSHLRESQKKALSADQEIQILGSLNSLRGGGTEETVLVIDDLSTADMEIRQQVRQLLSNMPKNLKVVVVVKAMIDVKELLPMAEALLRLKKTTAEVIYSINQERGGND